VSKINSRGYWRRFFTEKMPFLLSVKPTVSGQTELVPSEWRQSKDKLCAYDHAFIMASLLSVQNDTTTKLRSVYCTYH